MDLFVINRYTGNEINNDKTSSEHELKEKLFNKIEIRKQLNKSLKSKNGKHELNSEETENVKNNEFTECFKDTKKNKIKRKIEIKENSKEIKRKGSLEFPNENIFKIKKRKKENDISKKEDDISKKENLDSKSMNDVETGNETIAEILESERKEEFEANNLGFTILSDIALRKKEKVKRKLPDWLTNPYIVSVDLKNLTSTVDSITGLDEIFVNKLKENNVTHFFPVQSQIIPWLLENANRPHLYWPNDICVSAPTGSGKTLAFVLPILQVLYKRIIPSIRALVVLPVQDLANQVYKVFETYSKGTDLKIILLSKKKPFHEEQALICKNDGLGNWKTKVDIIITTPGRLVEHLNFTKGFSLKNLKYLVIDEADRVMEKMQNDWLYHLNKSINSESSKTYQVPVISYSNMIVKRKPPNKLLFSATLSQDPEKLQQLGLFQPKLFTSVVKSSLESESGVKDETKFIGKYTTPAELKENYTIVTKENKPLIVYHLLKSKGWRNVLCFVNSTEATFRLSYVLKTLCKKKIKIGKLSANLSVRKRDIVLQKFLTGQIDVLVSSDALARGMDIPNVEYVVSYDTPKYIKTYIHRIGRTGRAGKEGTSLTLLSPKEANHFQKMLKIAGKETIKEFEINTVELETYEKSYRKALTSLGKALEKQRDKTLRIAKKSRKLQILAEKGKFKNLGKKIITKKKKIE